MLSNTLLLSFLIGIATANDILSRACTPYKDAATMASACCDPSTHHLYTTNASLGLGICCLLDEILDGLTCKPPPSTESSRCTGDAVCPKSKGQDLGITYGSCYVLQGLSGLYLGHDSATKYEIDGENPGVVFRVCSDKVDCSTNTGTVVPSNGTWYMQDQFGDPSATGFGWLGGSGDLTVGTAGAALVVGGSELCYGGRCSVCITFPPGGAHAPCPLQPGQSHLGVAANPNSCQPFIWQEVPCRTQQ